MSPARGGGTDPAADGSFARFMEHAPMAVAVTRGPKHTLEFANEAFASLTAVGAAAIGQPIARTLRGPSVSGMTAVMDLVFNTGVVARDAPISDDGERTSNWRCTVWPQSTRAGRLERLVIELWQSSDVDLTLALQREVAERMLLSALRERDASDRAERSSQRALFLAAEGRRLAQSLDESATQEAVAQLAIPPLAVWCIVDVFDANDRMHRLRIVHPDATKQLFLRALEGRWSPEPSDPFGLPAAMGNREPTVIAPGQVDAALVRGARGPETLELLRAIGIGALLTVPLVVRDTLLGAVTFVSEGRDRGFSTEDVALARELAVRSAIALDSARLHGEALSMKTIAERASEAKTAFLGTMSHELRTPLNAIGGYADLLLLGLRGPLSPAQGTDVERIRNNQQHMLGLVTDVLNFVRLGSGGLSYDIVSVTVHEAVTSAVALVDALLTQRQLACVIGSDDRAVVAYADLERLQQILINLLSNAIKFTSVGGRITVTYDVTGTTAQIHVADTGIGIPLDRVETIFNPFVQVREGYAGKDTGVGLGLAISRDLARAMGGDLLVESALNRGSRFTVVLPRALQAVHEA